MLLIPGQWPSNDEEERIGPWLACIVSCLLWLVIAAIWAAYRWWIP